MRGNLTLKLEGVLGLEYAVDKSFIRYNKAVILNY